MGVSKHERLVNLALFFLSKKDHYVGLKEVAEKVEGYDPHANHDALRQMFFRDRKELKESGIIIESRQGDEKYRLSKSSYLPMNIRFREAEKHTLLQLLRTLLSMREFPFFEELKSAAVKLALNSGLGGQIMGFQPAISIFLDHTEDVRKNFEEAYRAIEKGCRLSFDYRTPDRGCYRQYDVEPLMLVFRNADLYLAAVYDGEIRFFKLDRMRNPSPGKKIESGYRWTREEIQQRISRQPWQYEEGPEEEVLIRLNPEASGLFLNTFSDAEIAGSAEGSQLVKLKISSRKRFVQLFMPFIFEAEVVEPDDLRRIIIESITELAGRC